jgi:hypothetical protein
MRTTLLPQGFAELEPFTYCDQFSLDAPHGRVYKGEGA